MAVVVRHAAVIATFPAPHTLTRVLSHNTPRDKQSGVRAWAQQLQLRVPF